VSDLSTLFSPERVAVVGATDRPGSVGRALVENLGSFEGEVLAVNPNRERAFGKPCYPSVGAVPDPGTVDLAVVAVPAPAVLDTLREIGAAGIRNVVVITAGFGERGEEGKRRQRALRETAAEYGLNLVGPNCVGLINTENGLNVTFARGHPPRGGVSLVSQSGAFIAAVLGWAERAGVGFRHVVSLGNEAVLDETDFIAEWDDDPGTRVVLAYVEDVADGRRFIETARELTEHTPVVAVKSGRTAAGAEAAASHTGAIAGSDEAYTAGFRQGGVLRADSVGAAFDAASALEGQPLPDGDAVAVVTNGGGPGVLATDAIAESRLSVASFDESLRRELADALPASAEVRNPLDVIGDADLERFRRSLNAVLGAESIHGAVVISVPTALFEFEDLADVIGAVAERHGKPVVACLMGGEAAERAGDVLDTYGVPGYFDPARAVPSLEALADYRDVRARRYEPPAEFEVDRERAAEVLDGASERPGNYLGVEAMDLLGAYGIPTPANGLAAGAAEAEALAAEIGGPVVLKIVSPDIVHKSNIGGVQVGVPVAGVGDAYRAMLDRAREYDPDATVLGVHVEELVAPMESTETIVGAKRDAQFGHLVMFGLGGIFVQVFEDTAFRVAPVSGREARGMTAEIRAAPMLRGARGRTPADLDAVVETVQRVSQLVTDFPAVAELDINPLVVSPDGVCALDLRLTVDGGGE
jgi:acetyltransferase